MKLFVLPNSSPLLQCILFIQCCLSLAVVPSVTHAQLSTTAIGVDPLRKQSYDCLRGENAKKNRVRITKLDTKATRSVARSKARRELIRSKRQAGNRLRKSIRLLKVARKQQSKLLKKLILTPKNQSKLDRLKERINNLDQRIGEFKGDLATIQEALEGVTECGKDLELNGSFQFISGTGVDALERTVFFAGYYFLINDWNESNEGLCVQFTGVSKPTKVLVHSPRECIQKDPVRGSDVCFLEAFDAFQGRYFVPVAFRNGVQDPGTCDPEPWQCSLSEAVGKVNEDLALKSYELVGVIPNGGECR